MKKVKIGETWVGDGYPCLIIAEAGSNHNSSLEQAKKLVDVAAEAVADAVKFQIFRASKLYPKSAGISDYLKLSKPIYDIMAEMEMPYEWIPDLAHYCHERNITFLTSVFDEESCDRIDPFLPAYKIASYEMTHLPLVRYVAQKRKPVIISTGTANLDEVNETVTAFRQTGNDQLILMQCTASYPAPLDSLNVRAIQTLKQKFDLPAGLSDHSRDSLVGPLAAVALGANIIEKHFTLSNKLAGPDHRFALEPKELEVMVRKIRELETALGSGEKIVQPVETELRVFARRSIFATCDIAAGEKFSPKNIAVLRCGGIKGGLQAKVYEEILDRKASRDILAETLICSGDYE